MAEPTPGPWTLVQMAAGIEVHGRAGELVHKEDWMDIPAELDDDRKEALWAETVANARLIAAAPAMLEALHHIKAVRCLGMHSPPVGSPAWHAWNAIDAAITAAKQEPDNG